MEDDQEHIFRLVDMGFTDPATAKGQPRQHTFLSLVDAIYTDGFVTQGDPLQMWKKPVGNAQGHVLDFMGQGALASLHCSGHANHSDEFSSRCSCNGGSWRRKPP